MDLSKFFGKDVREREQRKRQARKRLAQKKRKEKLWLIFEKKTNIPLDFVKWLIYDIIKWAKSEKIPHFYGIKMYCGLYGQGKTMSIIEYLDRVRTKHGKKVIIATNFYYKDEDFRLESWEQMLETYNKTVIFAIDEVQNEFNSRDYRNFPHSLITLLTQNRKGNGVQVVTSAQRYDHVDKIFRDLCDEITECKTFCGRLTLTKTYKHHDYQQYNVSNSVDNKSKIPKTTYWYIQTDRLRNLYDSYKMIESATERLKRDVKEEQKVS